MRPANTGLTVCTKEFARAILSIRRDSVFSGFRKHEKEEENPMKDLVTYLAQRLVDKPDLVSVNEYSSGQTLVLELRVEKNDMGKVIGREGRTAQALRTIINAASRKQQKRTVLEIIQ